MTKLSELREILRTSKIRGYSHYDKKQLIVLLGEKGLLPEELPKPVKVKEVKEIDPKYQRLVGIRTNPRSVILKNVKTGEEQSFSSIYKASRFIKHSPRTITFWDGKIWNDLYEIKISERHQVEK